LVLLKGLKPAKQLVMGLSGGIVLQVQRQAALAMPLASCPNRFFFFEKSFGARLFIKIEKRNCNPRFTKQLNPGTNPIIQKEETKQNRERQKEETDPTPPA
jgi:hypothetical protein